MLSPFFQPLYSTVLNEESTSLLPFSSDVQHPITAVLHLQIWEFLLYFCVTVQYTFCEFQLHCIELNVPSTNLSIQSARY